MLYKVLKPFSFCKTLFLTNDKIYIFPQVETEGNYDIYHYNKEFIGTSPEFFINKIKPFLHAYEITASW